MQRPPRNGLNPPDNVDMNDPAIAEYYHRLDGRVKARKRRLLGIITVVCLLLAAALPAYSAFFVVIAIFSGIGIGWVD
jgi:VIT1/CCC1 family predicted Fe2+/Mn2+ transporter